MSLTGSLLLDPLQVNIWIAKRTDGVSGSGTESDPFDGSTATKFDNLMKSFASLTNICVRLGPGTFDTTGYEESDKANRWKPVSGMKIIGSGIDVTTLRVVSATTNNKQYYAVAAYSDTILTAFEISDLSINSNLLGSENSGTGIAIGAIRVTGNQILIHGVKVINWGVKSGGPDCFVIALLTADPPGVSSTSNSGIDGCVAVQPATSSGKVTVLHAGKKEGASVKTEGFGDAPFIRNCFVDCGQTSNFDVEFRGLSMGWCNAGTIEGNQIHNTKYGGPYQDDASTRSIVVRNNYSSVPQRT